MDQQKRHSVRTGQTRQCPEQTLAWDEIGAGADPSERPGGFRNGNQKFQGRRDTLIVFPREIPTQLFKAGLDITIHGGNGDPIFDDLDVNTFDPDYKTIAEELLEHIFHLENKAERTVIETNYKP